MSTKEVAFFGELTFNQSIRAIQKVFKNAPIDWKKVGLPKKPLYF